MADSRPLFSEQDQPLRDDVRLLGAILGEVLKEQGPAGLYDRVEGVRLASRRRRQGDAGADSELASLLEGLDATEALHLVRAFSAYFFIVNMAERIHRLRRAIDYRREGRSQQGSWDTVVQELATAGVSVDELMGMLSRMQVNPVFTAHPTEATRRTLLVKEQRIARALMDRLSPESEPDLILARVRNEITVAWQTEEQLSVRPSVADEVEHILFYLSEVVYRIVPRYYQNLSTAIGRHYGVETPPDVLPSLLSFGSWVGGDMDGNPNVGPDSIRDTLARHQDLCLRKYREEVQELFGQLTQSTSLVKVDGAVLERVDGYRRLMPEEFDKIPDRYQEMPYRQLLWCIARRLDDTRNEAAHGYPAPEDFIADLRCIHDSLRNNRGAHAGAYLLPRLIRNVQTFGFHLATLDVRQHALTHRRAVGELLGEADFTGQTALDRVDALQAALEDTLPVPASISPDTQRCLEVVRAIAAARQLHGERAAGLMVISMAQSADDALAVLLLAKAAGTLDADGQAALDIAPLFETVDDLVNARTTLQTLWSNPRYRQHLRTRGDMQYVMLGYSDSNKDSGLAASRWSLYNAQREIVSAAKQAGVRVTLFHGRGGSISRGGGKPREAILAEPAGAIDGRLRVTEQGEIIHAKYGLRGLAIRTLELTGSAVLERMGPKAPPATAPEWSAAMQVFAGGSRERYRSLVYGDAGFNQYFREATPIDVIERMLIGSRPARRSGQAGIEDLRAIPWVFAWTQSRHILPGWYGVGSGLAQAEQACGIEQLRRMVTAWPFFNTLLSDAEMAQAKADLDIARRYAALSPEVGPGIFAQIEAEYARTREMICRVRETDALLTHEPVLRRALWLRNPYVDPMSVVQVDLLRRWRAANREDAQLERALIASVHGIARGMQNTG
jgi:phosphoenolpyruvate carboxylase